MIKLVALAAWVCVVCFGANYAMSSWVSAPRAEKPKSREGERVELKGTAPITVPIIRDNRLQGYLVMRLSYGAQDLAKVVSDPEAVIEDEVFRAIYSDNDIDLDHIKKIDFAPLLADAAKRVAERMKLPEPPRILMPELNYVYQNDVKR